MRASIPYLSVAVVLALGCQKEAPADPAPTAEPAQSAPAKAEEPPPEKVEAVASAAPSASADPEVAPKATEKSPAAVAKKPGPAVAPAPKAEERKVKTVRGSSASGTGFAVSIQAKSPVRSGESSTATVVLSSKDPFKCNDKYPYKMALSAPSGVSFASQTVRGASIGKKTTTLGIPFTAGPKGKGTIAGTFSFSVCTDDKCLIEKRPLSVTIDVD